MSAPRGVAVVLVSLLVPIAALSSAVSPGYADSSVAWPVSTGLVLAEAVTGGVSASDEYVEIYNAGAVAIDLGGCELVYMTASGATTTRKAAFDSPLPLLPGAHLLVANSAGVYAPLADATYTGGLAADGGSLAVRHVGGAVIDALSWGTASNAYVEGAVAPAPAAKSSLERKPGAAAGNWVDTNDNASDWVVQSNPVPQSLASTPVPAPSRTPPAGTSTPTSISSSPSGEPSEAPSLEPTIEPTGDPTIEPTGDPTGEPTSEPTAAPTLTLPAPTDPAVDLEAISAARSQAVGSLVHLSGVVTVTPGLVGADDLFAIVDSSGGIFVRLSAPVDGVELGRSIDIVGVLAAPYGQLEVRELEWLQLGTTDAAPAPIAATLPEIGERLEGSLVTVEGSIDSVTTDSGRLVLTLGDKQTELRALADPPSGILKADVTRGEQVTLTGIVGQRATALGREDGYRLWLRMRSDLTAVTLASPSPTGAPSAVTTPRPVATPTSVAVYHDLATGLAVRGRKVDVEATVTAAAGIIDWGGPTIVVDDGTAAVAVVLPDGVASPRVGASVHIAGKTGSLHSGRRVVATLVEGRGDGVPVQPRQVAAALGPSLEWQLVAVCGRVQRLTKAGSRWRADLTVDGQTVAVLGEPGAGISSSGIVAGRLALVTGIVRRSTSDPSVFQLLPRSAADLILGPAPASSGRSAAAAVAGQASGSGAAGASAPAGTLVTVSEITGREGETVTVAGLIVGTGPATATLDDGTGRVRLGGTAAADALSLLEPGDAVEVTGLVSRDADGWLIEVDPDLIVTLAAGGSGTTASSERSADNASPSADAASGAPGLEAPAARGQTHGLALAAGGIAGPSPIELIALFGGGLALVALLGLTVARAVRARRLRARPERPERSFRDAREHAMSPPDDLANGRYSSSERATAPGRDQGHA
jgi:hypothetical protein